MTKKTKDTEPFCLCGEKLTYTIFPLTKEEDRLICETCGTSYPIKSQYITRKPTK